MDPEWLALAREAVAALQTTQGTSWVDVAPLIVSGVGLSGIFWGLFQMQHAGRRRDREIDIIAETLAELLRRTK